MRKKYFNDTLSLKVRQSQKQIMVSSILPKKTEQNSLFLVKKMLRLVIFVRFFGRIEDTINCFRDLLTFKVFWHLSLNLSPYLAWGRSLKKLKCQKLFKTLIFDSFHLPINYVGNSSDAVSGWAGWALASLEFGVSVNPIPTRAGRQIMPTILLLAHPDLKT